MANDSKAFVLSRPLFQTWKETGFYRQDKVLRCTAHDDFERNAAIPHVGAKARKPRPLAKIAQRVAAARDKFRKVADEVEALQSSPEGFVLGADMSSLSIGSTSLVQDLHIPEAPRYWGMVPQEIFQRVDTYLAQREIPEQERQIFLDTCEDLLATLRGLTHRIADTVEPLLSTEVTSLPAAKHGEALDALIVLLQTCGFSILPQFPEINEPPSPESLPLGNSIRDTLDPTILRGSEALRNHIKENGIQVGEPLHYPHIFLATRGVSVTRNSGLLLPQKVRALERAYFSWIRSPFEILLQPIQAMSKFVKEAINLSGNGKLDAPQLEVAVKSTVSKDENEREHGEKASNEKHGRKVRRVVPAVKLRNGWNAISGLFLPSFTQEPSHRLMLLMYREIIPDLESIRREKREALLTQIRYSVVQAVNPVPPNRRKAENVISNMHASVVDGYEKSVGEEQPMTIELFADVPWGTMHHLFPSTFILPATRDLLRIDALTFAGLVSTIITYFRHSDSIFVLASLAGSILSYSVRVGFGWQQALMAYKGRIANDKASGIVSKQRNCLNVLANLSAEEMLVDVCCTHLCNTVLKGMDAQKVQRDIFGQVLLTKASVDDWNDWLEKEIPA